MWWWLGCAMHPSEEGPVDPDVLLAGLVDLSAELEALDRRVTALDAAPARPTHGCTTLDEIDQLLVEDLADSTLALVPQRHGGHPDGLVVTWYADPDPLARWGFEVGDRLISIQGRPIDHPVARVRLVRDLSLQPPTLVTVAIVRPDPSDREADQTLTLTYRVAEDEAGCTTGWAASADRPAPE